MRRSALGHRDALVGYQGDEDDRPPRERPTFAEYEDDSDAPAKLEGPRRWDEATRFRWLVVQRDV